MSPILTLGSLPEFFYDARGTARLLGEDQGRLGEVMSRGQQTLRSCRFTEILQNRTHVVVAQMARAPACQVGCRGFEPRLPHTRRVHLSPVRCYAV